MRRLLGIWLELGSVWKLGSWVLNKTDDRKAIAHSFEFQHKTVFEIQ